MGPAALILGLALAGLPVPTGSEVAWSVTNVDGTYVIIQTATPRGCHVEVVHDADQKVLWQKDLCLGGKSDPKLLSRDGRALVLLASYPAVRGAAWREVVVAWRLEEGEVVETAEAGRFVKDASAVRRDRGHFRWLQGVLEVPGVPPRLSADGKTVELEAIDGTHRVLGFDALGLPRAAPTRAKKRWRQ